MSLQPSPWRIARLQLTTVGQSRESVHHIAEASRGGDHTSGRLIKPGVEFAVDPGPELGRNGVISVNATGAEE
jgi:hypothetical protein